MEPDVYQSLLTLAFEMHENLISKEKESGEYFNIFRILRIETREVKTHSNFLTELLDPNGSHRLGTKPLEEFLRVIGITNADASKAKVTSEFTIGTISEDGRTGGRIDILIDLQTQPKQLIAIENKIYAGDQENQLQRYHAHTKAPVYYLTLHGGRPSSYAMNGLSDDMVECVSYANHITEWITTLINGTNPHELVHATLVQYKFLIEDLTGNSRRAKMTQDLASEITSNEKNLSAYFTLIESREAVTRTILNKCEPFFKRLAAELDLTVENQDGCIFFDFSDSARKELGLRIGFGSDHFPSWKMPYFGLYHDTRAKSVKARGVELFKSEFQTNTENWGSWIGGYWKEYENGESLLTILNNLGQSALHNKECEKFKKNFAIKLKKACEIAQKLCAEAGRSNS